MTEREKNAERLAMKISRHRQAKYEAIQYEDVKTAYIKGCEDTAKESVKLKSRDCWKGCLYASGKSELIHEYLQQKYNFTKAKELLAKWVELFKPKGGNIPLTPIQIATEQFLAGDL